MLGDRLPRLQECTTKTLRRDFVLTSRIGSAKSESFEMTTTPP